MLTFTLIHEGKKHIEIIYSFFDRQYYFKNHIFIIIWQTEVKKNYCYNNYIVKKIRSQNWEMIFWNQYLCKTCVNSQIIKVFQLCENYNIVLYRKLFKVAAQNLKTQVWEVKFIREGQRYFIKALDTAGGNNNYIPIFHLYFPSGIGRDDRGLFVMTCRIDPSVAFDICFIHTSRLRALLTWFFFSWA